MREFFLIAGPHKKVTAYGTRAYNSELSVSQTWSTCDSVR